MTLEERLTVLEDWYYGDLEEEKEPLIQEVDKIYQVVKDNGSDSVYNRFFVAVVDKFGGTYIPYLFWDNLNTFWSVEREGRPYLYNCLEAFAFRSDFDPEDQQKLKPLLIAYFAKEKSFEVNKIKSLIADKAHPKVREYFMRMMRFVEKNQKATKVFYEKFEMLLGKGPRFDLLDLPLVYLKEQLEEEADA